MQTTLAAERHQAGELRNSLAATQGAYEDVSAMLNQQKAIHEDSIREHKNEIQSLMADKERQHEELRAQWADEVRRAVSEVKTENAELKRRRAKDLENLREQQAKEINTLKTNHDAEMAELDKLVRAREKELLDNADNFRPATDGVLKNKFDDIKRRVSAITGPNMVVIHRIDPKFDPDGFLTRSPDQQHFLLQNVVWGILRDAFFSRPDGFGALGTSGDGFRLMSELLVKWQDLFDGDDPPGEPYGRYICKVELLLYANIRATPGLGRFRSAAFLIIKEVVLSKLEHKVTRCYNDHIRLVTEKVLAIFGSVTSGGAAAAAVRTVPQMVQRAAELALDFGSQRSEVVLDFPSYGSEVTLGDRFTDVEDGVIRARGSSQRVDIVVSPAVCRKGDGRFDPNCLTVVAKGEVFPLPQQKHAKTPRLGRA